MSNPDLEPVWKKKSNVQTSHSPEKSLLQDACGVRLGVGRVHGLNALQSREALGRLRDQSDWNGFSNQKGLPTNSVFNHARMGDSRRRRFLPEGAA
jgi:hypothetical protein